MTDIDMDKICSGCLAYEQYIKNPKKYNQCVGYIKKRTDCPCQHCLIKVMCDVCDEFKKEWEIFYNAKLLT